MCGDEDKPVCKNGKLYKNFCRAFCEGIKGDDLEDCEDKDTRRKHKKFCGGDFKTVE